MQFLISKVMGEASTDLHLGLSIGGSSGEAESAGQSQDTLGSSMGSGWANADLDVEDPTHFSGPTAALQQKRALQARYRLEAVKKQAEKRKKRAIFRRAIQCGPSATKEGVAPEPQPFNISPCEGSESMGLCAKPPSPARSDTEHYPVQETAPNPNPTSPNPNANPNPCPSQDPAPSVQPEAYGVAAMPVVPMPCPCAMPVANGFNCQYWMPVWPAVPVPVANPPSNVEGTVFQPLPLRAVPPASVPAGNPADNNVQGESHPTGNAETGVAFKQVAPSGKSSSGALEHQAGSFQEGSSSSDMKTELGQHARQKLPVRAPNRAGIPYVQSENSISSQQMVNPVAAESVEKKLEGATFMNKTIIREVNKKPQDSSPSRTQLLCVSTTGDGPNGKTITGLLYKYTRSNISIVCNCHGIPLSPADFVLHAGGTNIANPTKKIYMVKSP